MKEWSFRIFSGKAWLMILRGILGDYIEDAFILLGMLQLVEATYKIHPIAGQYMAGVMFLITGFAMARGRKGVR